MWIWASYGRNFTTKERPCISGIAESHTDPSYGKPSNTGTIDSGKLSNDDTVYTTSSPSSCDICGSHCQSSGVMGQQAYLMGKEACFEEVPRSVRERPWLHRLDPCKGKFSHSSHVRLPDALSSKGRYGAKHPPVREQDRMLEHLLMVESEEEIKRLMACRSDVETIPHQLDLLEVYAQADSRLSAEVSRLGGRSKRFTLQD